MLSVLLACSESVDPDTERDGARAGAAGASLQDDDEPNGSGGAETDAGTGGGLGGAGRGGEAVGGASLGGAGGASGSSGAGGSRVEPDEPPCDAVNEVFRRSCGTTSCHANPNATIGDFGVDEESARSYVDVPSSRDPSCGLMIDSSDPSESLILRKLTGDFEAPLCGGIMPVIGRDLTRDEIACVASWLEQFRR